MKKKELAIIVIGLMGAVLCVFCLADPLQRTQLFPSIAQLQPSDDITDPYIKEQFAKVKQWAETLQNMLDTTFRKIALGLVWDRGDGDDIYRDIGNVRIGSTTNNTTIAADGTMTMNGTGRVVKHLQGIEELGKGGSAPTVRTTEEPYVSYTYSVGNDSHITFEIPEEMDFTATADIKVHWYTSVSQTNDEVNWESIWNARAVGETVNAGLTTDTSGDINCSAQWIIVETTVETIPANSIVAGDIIGLHFERIAIIDGTNPSANSIHVLSVELHFTSNKLGEDT